jgi:16S rRNA (guanine527-N7)-methyltransferase
MFHVKHAGGSGVRLAAETRERLDVYVDLLLRWNARINLISPGDVSQVWTRHIEDSLQLLPFLDCRSESTAAGDAIDLGSGAGFPGLVLAIASNQAFHLVESDRRKSIFLREAARETGAPVTVHNARIETLQLPPAWLVTARALAPLETMLPWACKLLAENGFCLFLKGRTAEHELTVASREWHMRVDRTASCTDPAGSILKISEVRFVQPQPKA